MRRWKKWRARTSRKSSEAVLVAFLRSLPALCYQLLRHVLCRVRTSAVFVRDHYRGWWPFRLLSLQTAPGRLNCVWVGEKVKHWILQSWVSMPCKWPLPTRIPCQPEALWDQQCCELSNSAEWVSESPATVPSRSGRLPGWFVCCGQTSKIVVSFRSSNWQHYFNVVLQRRYPDFSWTLTASIFIAARLTLLSAVCKVFRGPSVHSAGFLHRQWHFDVAECR